MRSLVPLAVLGSFLVAATVQAQSLAEHAAAAAGATIGTAAGKPLSNALTSIFGNTDKAAQKAATQKIDTKTPPRVETPVPVPPAPAADFGSSSGPASEPAPARHGGFSKRPSVAQVAPIAEPALLPIPEPVKEPTAEELGSIQVGATEQQVFTTLGQPESKVVIPDDEHLIEICQYWAKGKQLGTVRLDNGQVVSIEVRN